MLVHLIGRLLKPRRVKLIIDVECLDGLGELGRAIAAQLPRHRDLSMPKFWLRPRRASGEAA